jgi:hypothetical protein
MPLLESNRYLNTARHKCAKKVKKKIKTSKIKRALEKISNAVRGK